MSDLTDLIKRIDGEFSANEQRINQFQAEQVKSYEERQQRLAQFEKTCDRLRSI